MAQAYLLFPMLTKSIVDAYNPSHTLLSLDGREDLGRVLESDRAFSQRVAYGEEVDKSDRISDSQHDKSSGTTYKMTGPT